MDELKLNDYEELLSGYDRPQGRRPVVPRRDGLCDRDELCRGSFI